MAQIRQDTWASCRMLSRYNKYFVSCLYICTNSNAKERDRHLLLLNNFIWGHLGWDQPKPSDDPTSKQYRLQESIHHTLTTPPIVARSMASTFSCVSRINQPSSFSNRSIISWPLPELKLAAFFFAGHIADSSIPIKLIVSGSVAAVPCKTRSTDQRSTPKNDASLMWCRVYPSGGASSSVHRRTCASNAITVV
jgi:hypothetical protein